MGLAWKVHLPTPEAMAAKRQRVVEARGGNDGAVRSSTPAASMR
jgi:hypothetical protein